MDLVDKYLGENKLDEARRPAPATNYTKQTLIKQGWATIGGRIEDYSAMYDKVGSQKTYDQIFKRLQ